MELVIDVARVEGTCKAGFFTGQRFCMSGTGLASNEVCRRGGNRAATGNPRA
ncbi:MAG: hypothetical protein ACOX4C_01320 [Bacillota bacterium]